MDLLSIIGSGPPTVVIQIRWDRDMDQTVVPLATSFSSLRDGLSVTLTTPTWGGPRFLVMQYAGEDPVSFLSVRLETVDLNLRDFEGTVAIAPQLIVFLV